MNKYSVIYVDPPWEVKKIIRKSRPNQTETLDYPTMSLAEIKKLPISEIAETNSTLWLWTTHAYLPFAFDVVSSWNFKYQRTITWDKSNGMCLFGFHHRTEFLLFAYKGKLEMYPSRKAFPTLISAKSPKHSSKPHVFRELIAPFGYPRIELFARESTEGWHFLGLDIDGNDIDSSLNSLINS